MSTVYLTGDDLVIARALLAGKLQVPEAEPDMYEPSEAAITASAAKLLRRAGVYEPTDEQRMTAREAARLEYRAQAEHATLTGSVRP